MYKTNLAVGLEKIELLTADRIITFIFSNEANLKISLFFVYDRRLVTANKIRIKIIHIIEGRCLVYPFGYAKHARAFRTQISLHYLFLLRSIWVRKARTHGAFFEGE